MYYDSKIADARAVIWTQKLYKGTIILIIHFMADTKGAISGGSFTLNK